MKVGMVSTIVTLEMMCNCGSACINAAGSYLITKEDKIVSCEVCYAQYQVTEDHFKVLPLQRKEVREQLLAILLTMPSGDLTAVPQKHLAKEFQTIKRKIEKTIQLVEKAS